MTWSRHPRRRVPTNLSVIAFAFGLNSDRLLPPFNPEEQVCAPDFLDRFLENCRVEAPMAFLARAVGVPW